MSLSIQKVREYTGHTGAIYGLATTPDSKRLFSAGDDGTVACWDTASGSNDAVGIAHSPRAVYALHYIAEEELLLIGTADGTVLFVSPDQRKVVYTFRKDHEPVYGFHYHAATRTACILHGKGWMTLLNLGNFAVEGAMHLATNHLRCIIEGPGPNQFLLGTSDYRIVVADVVAQRQLQEWQAHENSVFCLMAHPDARYLASGGRDAFLHFWDEKRHYAHIEGIPAHNFTVNDMALSPSGELFVTASRDKTLKVWDAYTFELRKVIDVFRNQGHTHSVNRVRWLSDDAFISCGDDRRIIHWGIES